MERKVAFKALVGSHNYNLADRNSDKDYKVFVIPTFDDLYEGKTYSKQIIGEDEDIDIHDIRKLPNLFYKANINFLEVLFSDEIVLGEDLSVYEIHLIQRIFEMKDDITRMNLPYLFNACGGMHIQKMKLLHKGTEGTQNLVDKFGYDTKQAQHAYRVIDFVNKFEANGFTDFKEAITYDDEGRKFMLDIKDGFFDIEGFENFISFYHDAKFKPLKEKYHSSKPNEKLKHDLDLIIKDLIMSDLGV